MGGGGGGGVLRGVFTGGGGGCGGGGGVFMFKRDPFQPSSNRGSFRVDSPKAAV